jgi:hypothetical protein
MGASLHGIVPEGGHQLNTLKAAPDIRALQPNKRCSRQALSCSALRAQLLDVLAAELRR